MSLRFLVYRSPVPMRVDGPTVMVDMHVDEARSYDVDLAFVRSDRRAEYMALGVVNSVKLSSGSVRITGLPVSIVYTPPTAGGGGRVRYGEINDPLLRTMRTEPEALALRRLRNDWERRYNSPRRQPLTTPDSRFSAWLRSHDPGIPLLSLAAGDGRNLLEVDDRRSITAVELTHAGQRSCCERLRPGIRTYMADLYRWIRWTNPSRRLVSLMYVQRMSPRELDVLCDFLSATRLLGGAAYIDMARFALSEKHQSRIAMALESEPLVYRRSDDDIERICLATYAGDAENRRAAAPRVEDEH